MANKFVWSGATGANDGSSWDNAYTTLMKDWGAEAGFTPATDYVYVRSVHSESTAGALTLIGSTGEGTTAACRILSVVGDTTGTSPGNLATGAAVATTGLNNLTIKESLYVYGVSFNSGNDLYVGGSATEDGDITLDSCTLKLGGSGAFNTLYLLNSMSATGSVCTLINVTCDFTNAGQGLSLRTGILDWRGGSVAYDVNTLIPYLTVSANGGPHTITGVDFSAMTSSSLVSGDTNANAACHLVLSRCLLPTGSSIITGTIDVPGVRVESYHCQIGTDSDPAYQMEIQDARGKISANTAKYRTGGASDGVRSTPISWDFDTTAGSVRGYPGHAFEGPPITAWSTGDGATQHTYRVAFASDASINDDELWMELEGPNDAATNSMAVIKTTRVAPLTAAAAYTTDSASTWNGTGVTTKQYMQVQYTPDKPGPVTVRVFMAKASDNIYVDPVIQIDP